MRDLSEDAREDIRLDVLYERTRDAMDVYEDDETSELGPLFPADGFHSVRALGL